jgi:hypothetical protein
MRSETRSAQLQIRVTPEEKAEIARAARRAGLGMSAYVLARVLADPAARWRTYVRELERGDEPRIALAGLSAWLGRLGANDLPGAVDEAPPAGLSDFHANYVAAMVEQVCASRGVAPPGWTRAIVPLERPAFASALSSLRLHLLRRSPPPFRRRNLFVDSSAGAQV